MEIKRGFMKDLEISLYPKPPNFKINTAGSSGNYHWVLEKLPNCSNFSLHLSAPKQPQASTFHTPIKCSISCHVNKHGWHSHQGSWPSRGEFLSPEITMSAIWQPTSCCHKLPSLLTVNKEIGCE